MKKLTSSRRLHAPSSRVVAAGIVGFALTFASAAHATAPATVPRTAWDLTTNRVHAVTFAGGRLVASATGPEFLKYVDGSWKTSWMLGQRVDGRAAAVVSGLSALFFFPLDTDGEGASGRTLGPSTLRLYLRGLAPGQKLSVFVNEKPVGTVDVAAAWGFVDLNVPVDALKVGENRVRLTFRAAAPFAGGKRAAAALEGFSFGAATSAAADAAPAALEPADVDVGGERKRALVVPAGGRLSFYAAVPSGARLVASQGARGANARVVVRVVSDGVSPRTLYDGSAAARWSEAGFDLGALAGKAARIDLVSMGADVAWAAPRLVVDAPTAAAPPPPVKVERVYIWMVDTLRADRLRCYNPKSVVETPSFDAFAADATRFAWAQVPGTWSLPSHASILTGVYPVVHKATEHTAKLSTAVSFLPEELKKAGYKTALFSSNGYISSKWGFERGWDESRNFIRESLPNGADWIWKTAKPWLTAQLAKPHFIYFATVEPHVIYNPKKEFLLKYWNKPYAGPIKPALTGIQLGQIKSGKLKVTDTDKAYLEALYNAEVTQADAAFGQFVAELKTMGVYDKSAIVVIADHGDEFWDHGDVGHAQSVYQELVRVPLIVRAPGLFPKGKVVQTDVEAMDIFPTLLELAGVRVRDDVQGESLRALAWDEVGRSPRASLSLNGNINRGLKSGRYRLVLAGAGSLELYDELEDPRDQKNLADKHPIALRQMRNVVSVLVAHEGRWRKREWGSAATLEEAFYKANATR